jgi:hypothetical protein
VGADAAPLPEHPAAPGPRRLRRDHALHLDADGATILIPVEVRTSWAEFMKMCHERPLPLQALDDANLLQAERMWNRS